MARRRASWLVLATTVVSLAAAAQGQTVFYVDDDASPGGDGLTWETGFRFLQDALAVAGSGNEIRVGQGTYRPDRDEAHPGGTGDQPATFQLLSDVQLLGGYAGIGTGDPDARDMELYETTLSGDLSGDDEREPDWINYEENSWHVVTGSGTDTTALIEGFTITAGYASGTQYPVGFDAFGGGMFNDGGSPTVRACSFEWNRAMDGGAGMANIFGSSPIAAMCVFDHNWVEESAEAGGGGGVTNAVGSQSRFSGCTFTHNTADTGGGVYNYQVDRITLEGCDFDQNAARNELGDNGGGVMLWECGGAVVTECTFQGNTAYWGGGLACFATDAVVTGCAMRSNSAEHGGGIAVEDASPTIVNTLFLHNVAGTYGGGLHTWTNGDPAVINCTFNGNSAPTGGGVYAYALADPTLFNCILWGNTGSQIGGVSALVRYSDVQGGYPGAGNIAADPLCDADGRPQAWSPCIDAGANNAVPADGQDLDEDGDTTERLPLDLDGLPRFADDPSTVDSGCGAPAVVDMGAYEYQGDAAHPVLIGDVGGDGIVGFTDLLEVLSTWGACAGDCCPTDVDFDSEIGFEDLLIVLSNWS